MARKGCAVLVLAAAMLSVSLSTEAFGPNGHRIVAGIAQQHLTPAASEAIEKISMGQSLSALATWPDEMRSDPAWDYAKNWHFLSIEDEDSFDDYEHDSQGDLITALNSFEKKLRENTGSAEERWQALAFYIHFVGDIHQPLHVGRTDDRGGNSIAVQWFEETSNLHSVWDSGLIDHEQLSFTEYVGVLNNASAEDIASWQSSTYLDWARESKAQRLAIYDFGDQRYLNFPRLEYTYVFKQNPRMQAQLLKGGIRLAGKLNTIFGKQ